MMSNSIAMVSCMTGLQIKSAFPDSIKDRSSIEKTIEIGVPPPSPPREPFVLGTCYSPLSRDSGGSWQP